MNNPREQGNERTGTSGSMRSPSRNSEQPVSELMTRNPECVTERDSIRNVAKLMLDNDAGSIPVVEENGRKVIGIITDRDIVVRLVAAGRDMDSARVSEAMTRGAKTVRQDQSVDSVYDIMSREQIRRVPVVDHNDEIVGIVAVKDLALEDDDKHDLAQTVEQISEGPGSNQGRGTTQAR